MARSKGSTAKSGRHVQGWQPGDMDAGHQPVGHQQQWDHQQGGWDPAAPPASQGAPAGYADPYARPPYHDPVVDQHAHIPPADPYGHGHNVPPQNLPPTGGHPQSAARGNWPPQFDNLDRAPVTAPARDPYRPAEPPRRESAGYPDSWREQPQDFSGRPAPAYQPGGYAAPESHPPLFGDAGQAAHTRGYPLPGAHPAAPHGYAPHAAPQPQAGYYDPTLPPAGHAPAPGHHAPNTGFGLPPQARSDGWPAGEHENWDLSQYAPGQVPPDQQLSSYAPSSGQPHGYGHDLGGHAAGGDPQWHGGHPQQQWGQDARGYQPGLEPSFADPQHAQYHQGYDQFGSPVEGAADDEYEDEDQEVAPRRKSRKLVLATVFVGAICGVSALAYGYNKLLGSGGKSGDTPVVRADQSPARMKPAEPGGKDVANIDKKFLNRLAEDRQTASAATAAPAAADSSEGGTRKVTTLIVNRDGTLSPQLSAAPSQPSLPPAPVSSGVPGMFVEGLQPMQRTADPAPEAAPPARPVVTNAPPKVADLPMPKVREPAPPKKRPAVRDDAAAPAQAAPGGRATTTASTGAAGANGFVAVLASRKSREEALRSFVDLHQKYPDALSGRTPDVREADLGDKGVWYRLIVGPPGSREAANDVCTKLKTQGFTGCWASAY